MGANRNQQKACFSYANCNTTSYLNFYSCTVPKWRKAVKCSYVNNFYMRLLLPFDEITCVKTGVPGPFTPNKQANGFICYGTATKALTFTNDVPYQQCAKKASNCPDESPRSYEDLCNSI